jgi:hypothetical protein
MYHADVVPGTYIVGVLAATTTFPATASDAFQRALTIGDDGQRAYMDMIVAGGSVLPRGLGTRVGGLLVNQMNQNNAAAVPPLFDAGGRQVFYPTTYHPSSTTAQSASIVNVASGEERTGINLDLRPIPVRRVSGRVMGPGQSAGSIALRLVQSDPATQRTSPATMIDTPQALADTNGNFTFLGIAPGSYRLRVIRTSSAPDQQVYWNADPVTVGDSDVVDLQVVLQPGVQVRGQLAFDSSNPPPAPAARRSLSFGLRPVPGSLGAMQTITGIERVDDAGRFTTRPVIPGPYVVTVGGVPAGWVLKTVTAGGQNAVDTPFDVGSTGVNDMVITITDRISVVAGTVRDANGRPSGSATVGVFPMNKTLWRLPGLGSRRVQVAIPGRDGRYTFRGLPAGEYFVVAVDGAAVDFSDPSALNSLMALPATARVTLADGDSKTQDLTVTIVRAR